MWKVVEHALLVRRLALFVDDVVVCVGVVVSMFEWHYLCDVVVFVIVVSWWVVK